jgi:hypothetical protein
MGWLGRCYLKVNPDLSPVDLGWVSGFLEGEGSFHAHRSEHGSYIKISAPQKQREPLGKLQSLLGGSIYTRKCGIYLWNLSKGAEVAGWMMTLYSYMSPKRKGQIKRALSVWQGGQRTRHWFGPAQQRKSLNHGRYRYGHIAKELFN